MTTDPKRSAQLPLVGVDGSRPPDRPETAWARDLLDSLQLRRVRTPLEAEVAASVIASAWRPGVAGGLTTTGSMGSEDPEVTAGRMIDAIATVRRTDALVLLIGLAAVVPPPLSERAMVAARLVEGRGVKTPKWLAQVGRVSPTGAWRMHHTLGGGDNLVLGFRHADGTEHSIVVYVDHDLGGLAKDAFVSDPAAETLELFATLAGNDPDLRIEPVPLADAGAWVRRALGVTDRDWPMLQTEEYPAIRPLLDARLSLLDEVAPTGDVEDHLAVLTHPQPVSWTGVPHDLRARAEQIIEVTDRACEQVLDSEYQTLARRLTITLARKRPSPLKRGRPEIWAGGVLWALGRINWLFARNATVHATGEQLAEAVGAKPKSIAAKADVVGDATGLRSFDPRYTRQELLDMGQFAARLRYRY